ncbi:MAG: hypothetical protein IJC74_08470 [Clostridia bacterium]|nr:hypothetical protein [Clostridia bacterium]
MKLSYKDVSLIFDADKGKIISLNDGKKEYISTPVSLFKISLRNENGEQLFEESETMKMTASSETENQITARYDGDFCTAEIKIETDDKISWFIKIKPRKDLIAEWVNYPQIAVPDDLSEDGYNILWGFNEGVLVDSMEERELNFAYIEPEYPSKGLMGLYPAVVETQFMAYFSKESGLYIGAHDIEDCLKGVDFYRTDKGGILLEIRNFCGCRTGEEYCMPYPVVVQFFKGQWQDAAEIYRKWFDENKKDDYVPILKNKKLPEWYGESPVVITYPVRGTHDMDIMTPNAMFPYINAMKHVERLEKELESRILVLLMHWEGTAPWAPPYVWPPFGGEDELKKFIDALHERGDVLGVYCSGIGWTVKSNVDDYETSEQFERENLKEEMCLSPKQTLPYSNICTNQRVGYDLCPSRKFTVDTLTDQVEKMVGAGIDYIQLLDQNHGGTPYFCYSKNHGHPPVPGKWQVDAMKEILSGITAKSGKVLFGCESAAAEAYAPYLLFSDNRFELNYVVGKQVPVYAYILHEYLNNFMGNQVCAGIWLDHDNAPGNIYERIAYSFSAGDMLTLVLDQFGEITWNWGELTTTTMPSQENVKILVRNLNSWRRGYGKKYLHTGRMTKGFEIECGVNEFARVDLPSLKRSALHTSSWISHENTFGQFVINYNDRAEKFSVTLPDDGYKLVFANGTRKELNAGVNTISIEAFSAVFIERK